MPIETNDMLIARYINAYPNGVPQRRGSKGSAKQVNANTFTFPKTKNAAHLEWLGKSTWAFNTTDELPDEITVEFKDDVAALFFKKRFCNEI